MLCRLVLTVLIAVASAASAAPEAAGTEPVSTESVSPLGNKDVGKTETAIGDLAADAVRSFLNVNIAFIAASELKLKDPPFPAGKITTRDIEPLISYPDDPLAVLEISGKAVRQALERSVSIYPQPNLGFLQVSGLEFTFDPAKPSGQRVTSIRVGGVPVSDDAGYSVGVTNSVANGALGYWKCWEQDRVKQRRPDATIAKAIEAYFKANPKIDYSKLTRITPAR